MSALFWVRLIDMNPILNRDGAITEILENAERIADWVKQFYLVMLSAKLILYTTNSMDHLLLKVVYHEITTLISNRTCHQFFGRSPCSDQITNKYVAATRRRFTWFRSEVTQYWNCYYRYRGTRHGGSQGWPPHSPDFTLLALFFCRIQDSAGLWWEIANKKWTPVANHECSRWHTEHKRGNKFCCKTSKIVHRQCKGRFWTIKTHT
jgi:hypothetical protein